MHESLLWLGLVFFVLASGFFSGAETGFYVLSRFRLEILRARGELLARRVGALLDDRDGLLITCLIGTNLANQLATETCNRLLEIGVDPTKREILATLVLSPLLYFFGEAFPKDLFRSSAETLVYRSAPLLSFARWIFRPATVLLRVVTNAVSRLLRVKDPQRIGYRGRRGLAALLSEGLERGLLSDAQEALAHNVLGLRERKIEAVMIPRDRVASIEVGASSEQVLELARAYPHSRFPVLAREQVVGYIHVGDVVRAPAGTRPSALIRMARSFPPGTPVPEALTAFRRAEVSIAFVVDEDGTMLGAFTAKDLVEEIVGEFEDL